MGRFLLRALIANGFVRLTEQAASTEPAPRRRMLLERLEDRLLFDAGPVAPIDADAELAQQAHAAQEAMPLNDSVAEPAEVRLIETLDRVEQAVADLIGQPLDGQHEVLLDPNDTPRDAEWLDSDEVAQQLLTTVDEQRTELHAATSDMRHELAFVDTSVADYETLVDGIRQHSDQFRQIEVVLIDAGEDGLAKIGEVLRAAGEVDAIHIISHGSETGFGLGGVWVTSESFSGQAAEFAAWGRALSNEADLLIYGCNLAATESGRELLRSISLLTGADVAASDDRTGHLLRNADWDLEVETGSIESVGAVSAAAQAAWDNELAASITVDPDPVTWHVVGLDSNNVNTGPNRFPIGAKAVNDGDVTLTNVTATLVWDSANANINVSGATSITIPSLAPGTNADVFFNVQVTRTTAAWNTTRDYHIEFTSDQGATTSSPNREIYVEKLVSQNRNSVASVAELSSGLTTLQVGNTYTIRLIGSTATNGYEQLEHVVDFPTDLIRVVSVSATYTAPTGGTNDSLYADAAGWDADPASPTYRTIIGPASYSGGKAGGDIVVDYVIAVIGAGTAPVASTIYDFSGSSYHYNSDFQTEVTFTLASAPTTANNAVTTSEDTSRSFVASDFPFSDSDGGTLQSVKITSLPADGLLKLNGADVTAGQVISVANINSGLLNFTPDANENGSPYTTFGFTVSDGTLSSTLATLTVNVTPVNDPPTGGNRTVTTAEDTDFTFTTADFPFSDVDGDSLTRVRVDTLSVDGTVLLSGVAVTAGQIITAANITTGNLKFRPDSNENGSPYTTFTFSAGDASTFVALPSTLTVNVTPVNDPPVADDETFTVAEDGAVIIPVLTGDTDLDGDTLTVSDIDGTNGVDPTPANNWASGTDTLDAAPDLRLTKTDFTNSISPGPCTTYTLNVGNLGDQGATNVIVTETLPNGTTFNPASSDPAWTNVGGNVYQYSILSLPAGASFNVNFSVLIDNPAVAGQDQIINTATIADDGTNAPDLDPTNNSTTDTDALDALPMYDIGIDDLQLSAVPGQSLTYYVNFNNYGLQNGTGVVISASFPTAILTNVVASDGGIVDPVAGTITWNVGSLSANDPRTFSVTADVRATVPSGWNDLTLSASITDDGTNGADPDLSDNSAADTDRLDTFDTFDAQPDYAITIDDGETIARPGDPLTYTINVANNGHQAGNGVVVTVSFPTALLANVVVSNGGIVDHVAATITWNLGDLAAGDSTTLTVNTQVRGGISSQTPSITLTATVTDDGLNGPDPTPLNNLDRALDRFQIYAYDSFHDWKDMRVAWLMPQTHTVGRPLAPLPVDPVFSGLTEPGSTLVARIYDADGRLLGDRQVVADAGGNWLVTFPNIIIYEQPHRMEIIVTPAISNVSHENGFNLRRYFHPAIHAGLVMTESLSVAGVFRNRASNIVEAQHSANTRPLGFQWYSHAYELNAASSNISQM